MYQFYNWLDKTFSATAWAMETPKAYGLFHLSFMLIGFAICGLAAWRLRHASEKVNKIILLSVGIFLAVSEVYKQLFYYFYMNENTYAWWIFPFQLCSVPMYLCIIAPLLKPGKLQKAMYSFMMIYNLLGGAISFAEPSGLLHPYWTLTIHALIWHMLLVFVGLYLCFSGRGGHTAKDYRLASVAFICLCGIAFLINLLLWDVSEGTINMFFVGPRNSSLAVFSWIAETFGWYVSTALYIPAVCLGAYIIFLPMYIVFKHKAKENAVVK